MQLVQRGSELAHRFGKRADQLPELGPLSQELAAHLDEFSLCVHRERGHAERPFQRHHLVDLHHECSIEHMFALRKADRAPWPH